MKNLKLNLGRLNSCVTYLSDSEIFRSPIVFGEDNLGQTVFYLKAEGGPVLSTELDACRAVIRSGIKNPCIDVPILIVGGSIRNGRISIKECLDKLLCLLELKVFVIIETILRESKIKENFKDILITLGNVEVFDNTENEDSDVCYGWVKVRVAITD